MRYNARIYGFVQEEDGVVSRLLTEISAYFEYLARQHGDYVAFHNVKIPMGGVIWRSLHHITSIEIPIVCM